MSNTITPIVVPVHRPKCPKCLNDEDKITVCKNCGHEYKNEIGCFGCLFAIFCGIIVVWLAITLAVWIGCSIDIPSENKPTLVEIIKSQWDFISALRIF